MMITESEILLRLAVAALLGGFVGLERERSSQPAGLRTHIILVLGAALAMTLSINLSMQFRPVAPGGDPARLAAQVISGIGFLGAGAIMRYGVSIKGLTTAASLWTMAIVGLAVGAGYMLLASVATALLLVTLYFINIIEKRFLQPSIVVQDLMMSLDDGPYILDDIKRSLEKHCKDFTVTSVEKNLKHKRVKVEVTVKLNRDEKVDDLMDELALVQGMRGFRIA